MMEGAGVFVFFVGFFLFGLLFKILIDGGFYVYREGCL